ncbi:hypothetical protein [Nocardia sp. NPDC056000]|uniref:hypothetical protein n=1 Tax=Nocardia sp. NPDC056000 TaxID=3345674 RepID=UPI0035D9A538
MSIDGEFTPKSAEQTLAELRQHGQEWQARRRAEIAAARTAGTREPFDITRFAELYPIGLDLGDREPGAGDIEEYEHKYYLCAPTEVDTLEKLAEHLMWLHTHDAG